MKKLMHTLALFSFLTISLFNTSSCSLIDDAKTIDFDVTLEKDFFINASEEGGNTYEDSQVLDASTNPDIRDNLSKIEKYAINKIEYSIGDYVGSATTQFSGSIQFSDQNSSQGQFTASLNGVNLNAAVAAGQQTLPVSDSDLAELEKILKNSNSIKIFMVGSFTEIPVSFTLNIKLSVNVEADATK
ncbi:hypothetical protein QQ008_02840 [Fulvivirgaceae bacterium BMA10]|uniref:Uncharacterized protein n=1 Tax=Splendidivirga corallicola TaxID=3051826 RepID=A0ABT8KHS0_9BACT|nr:hypothetical protein [Fulvivirgaceae bacterium BMA10]